MFSQAIGNITVVSQVLSLLLVMLTLGIANTLIIDMLDRRRELGLAACIEFAWQQVAASVVIEVAIVVTLLRGEIFAIRFVLGPDEVTVSLGPLCAAALSARYWPAR